MTLTPEQIKKLEELKGEYYFLYYMTRNHLTYKQAKDELLTSADFEKYKPKGKKI